jgi:hypothetical protein
MQGQPRPTPSRLRHPLLDPRRRAVLVGLIMALLGIAILLRPHGRVSPPMEGSDVATLANMINLPAVPVSVHWRVHPMTTEDSARVPGPDDWTLDATLAFSAADTERITGVNVFYKSPLDSGTLIRIDDTHFKLVLTTK